jgi:hypothetical protein
MCPLEKVEEPVTPTRQDVALGLKPTRRCIGKTSPSVVGGWRPLSRSRSQSSNRSQSSDRSPGAEISQPLQLSQTAGDGPCIRERTCSRDRSPGAEISQPSSPQLSQSIGHGIRERSRSRDRSLGGEVPLSEPQPSQPQLSQSTGDRHSIREQSRSRDRSLGDEVLQPSQPQLSQSTGDGHGIRERPRSRDRSLGDEVPLSEPQLSQSRTQDTVLRGEAVFYPQCTKAEAVRYSLGRLATSKAARSNCRSEEFRMRVHACALRLLDSIACCKSLFPSPAAMPARMPSNYDVKVLAQAIYGVAFKFEDDAEVSDDSWTRRSLGVCAKHVAAMECRVVQLFWEEGKGNLLPPLAVSRRSGGQNF